LAPVFNPEVAAQAILYAISSQKREVCVGASTLLAVWRARLLPGSLDRYLARQAYRGQISDVPAESIRWDNLFAPAPLRVGSRGRFDREAKAQSWHLRLMLWPIDYDAVSRAISRLATSRRTTLRSRSTGKKKSAADA
jgi:hypothetical protein